MQYYWYRMVCFKVKMRNFIVGCRDVGCSIKKDDGREIVSLGSDSLL